MSELRDKQHKLCYMAAQLVLYAYDTLGWKLTCGDAYRDPRSPYGSSTSLHCDRLAVDYNLFVDGEWIDGKGTSAEMQREFELWEQLGNYWESLGGSWGGRFLIGRSARDLNHFSLEHQGRR